MFSARGAIELFKSTEQLIMFLWVNASTPVPLSFTSNLINSALSESSDTIARIDMVPLSVNLTALLA